MDLQLIAVPYDSGNYRARMGAGPEALLAAGLERALERQGYRVHTKMAEHPDDSWHAEIQTGFELMRMVSNAVREARESGRLPIVLAGNCNTAVGTIAGLGDGVGIAWFDAHGDFNTPETTTSGFLDGTAVAIITGRCWKQLAVTIPGFQPIPDERVCIVGARDIDILEGRLLAKSNVDVIEPNRIRPDLPRALNSIGRHVDTSTCISIWMSSTLRSRPRIISRFLADSLLRTSTTRSRKSPGTSESPASRYPPTIQQRIQMARPPEPPSA